MAIQLKITIDNKKIEKIFIKARKTLDDNIIVFGHPEIDIMVLTSKSKIVALPKEELDDEVYESQRRLFKYLVKQGVVDYASVQAGNLFMSTEGTIPEPSGEGDKIQYCLYSISNFLDDEQPYYDDQKEFEKEVEDSLLDPETDEHTLFDPSMHGQQKGSLPPARPSYGINTIYRI